MIRYERHPSVTMLWVTHHADNEVDFVQANKKDVTNVTKSQYTITTTCQGKLVRDGKSYDKVPVVRKFPGRVRILSVLLLSASACRSFLKRIEHK